MFIALSRFILNLRQADHYRTGQSMSDQLEEVQFGYPRRGSDASWVASFAGPMYCDDQPNDEVIREEMCAAVSEPVLPDDVEAAVTHTSGVVKEGRK